jgi:hypothetical protein
MTDPRRTLVVEGRIVVSSAVNDNKVTLNNQRMSIVRFMFSNKPHSERKKRSNHKQKDSVRRGKNVEHHQR